MLWMEGSEPSAAAPNNSEWFGFTSGETETARAQLR